MYIRCTKQRDRGYIKSLEITFAKALKSAKPPPNDSLPNTAANGSETSMKNDRVHEISSTSMPHPASY